MQVFSISYLISCPHFKIQLSLIHATEKIILLDSGENWPSDYISSITHDLYSSVQFFSPPFPKYSSINSCKNLGSVILQGIFKPWWHCRHRVNPPCLAIHAQTNPMHPQMCKCFVHKINKHTQCALCKSVCVDIYMYIIMHYHFFFFTHTLTTSYLCFLVSTTDTIYISNFGGSSAFPCMYAGISFPSSTHWWRDEVITCSARD